MFQINSYLQYKNTPNGKPRVLREEVDYTVKTKSNIGNLPNVGGGFDGNLVVDLSDCRPLLNVEIKHYNSMLLVSDLTVIFSNNYIYLHFFDGFKWRNIRQDSVLDSTDIQSISWFIDKGWSNRSFFDDPAKYSKLLWNYSEEEGWQKVFKLLNIEL
jgi:hypothetical protein